MLERWFERAPEKYAPYAGHILDNVVLLLDGSVMAMVRLAGLPFELSTAQERNARERRLNQLARYLSDDNVLAYAHLVHWVEPEAPPALAMQSDFGRDLIGAYSANLAGRVWRNDWFLTIIVRQRMIGVSKARKLIAEHWTPPLAIDQDALRQLENAMLVIEAALHEYTPRWLGYREANGWRFSEIGEALRLIRTADFEPIPDVCGSLGAAVYRDPVVVRRRSLNLNLPSVPRVGAMLAFREYPAKTRPGMLNSLLSAEYPFVLGQAFKFMSRGTAEAAFSLKLNQLVAAGDRALSQQQALIETMDEVASNVAGSGLHHLTLAVYAPDLHRLDRHVADASRRLADFGGSLIAREWLGLESSYWSQMPGATEFRMRTGKISTRNWACLASFESYPTGQQRGYWGPAILRFRTRGGTGFDFVPHCEDVGHTLLIGRNGSGKTALMGTVAVALEPVMGERGMRVLFDKDGSNKLTVECSGGRYLRLHRGRASGLSPLRGLPDTPGNRSFLQNLFVSLIERDGRGSVSPSTHARMARGIARQMQMPLHLRTMTGVREFLGYEENGDGHRFQRWCEGGSMGWLLAGETHLVDFAAPIAARFYGFDLTELLPTEESLGDDGACQAAVAVIFHQLRQVMDGRRIAAFCDETRFYMDVIGNVLDDLTLTGRKHELMLWMAAQETTHFSDHPKGGSIISQCRTKFVWPDPSADAGVLANHLKLTPAAIRAVREDMTIGAERSVLLWREGEPVVLTFDISALREELAILSARAGTIREMDAIKAERPDAPASEHYREFRRRVRTAKAA